MTKLLPPYFKDVVKKVTFCERLISESQAIKAQFHHNCGFFEIANANDFEDNCGILEITTQEGEVFKYNIPFYAHDNLFVGTLYVEPSKTPILDTLRKVQSLLEEVETMCSYQTESKEASRAADDISSEIMDMVHRLDKAIEIAEEIEL